jgi:hypothetical protein
MGFLVEGSTSKYTRFKSINAFFQIAGGTIPTPLHMLGDGDELTRNKMSKILKPGRVVLGCQWGTPHLIRRLAECRDSDWH